MVSEPFENADKTGRSTAIWALTPNAARLAGEIGRQLPEAKRFLSGKLPPDLCRGARCFDRLQPTVQAEFENFRQHIFIMATGIVVRMIAPCIRNKTVDPAVVVADEAGRYVISLLSGHIGGANELARQIADLTGTEPVITTATDVNQVLAIDEVARNKNLRIENPGAIKIVNMSLVTGKTIWLHDPHGHLHDAVQQTPSLRPAESPIQAGVSASPLPEPGVFIDDTRTDLPEGILVLRPPSLAAGIGCNRNTSMNEIQDLLCRTFDQAGLSLLSLRCLASIDVKHDEKGLLALADTLDLPLRFFNREELNRVETIQNPSDIVERHVGVKSVCEAAAILAADNGELIVTKQTTPNVTLAVARQPSMW